MGKYNGKLPRKICRSHSLNTRKWKRVLRAKVCFISTTSFGQAWPHKPKMNRFFKHKRTLKNCHIYKMLRSQNGRHLSFHTPGHKRKGWDITELSYSDNLSSPKGCILKAESDISAILRSEKSFILTDGSTSGVLSMLYAAKSLGARSVCFSQNSHKSVYNGCSLLGFTPLIFSQR